VIGRDGLVVKRFEGLITKPEEVREAITKAQAAG